MVWVVVAVLVALQIAFVHSPVLNSIFGSTPLPLTTWYAIAATAGGVFLLIEIEKLVRRRLRQAKPF